MRTRILTLATLSLLLAACADRPDQLAGPDGSPAPLLATGQGQDQLPDRYIVVFRDDVPDPEALADQLVRAYGGQIHFRYAHALKGFAATLPATALEGIQRNPSVSYIEADQMAYAIGDDGTPGSWGLDRIDERDLPLDGNYHWDTDGSGVTAYIIDTGIRTSHDDFGGRASVGFDAIGDGQNGQDCHGHGTHVAGTVGGTEYGVAKGASLVAVRVLNCAGSGSYSQVIAGINWVTANAVHPAAANMSLGGGFSSALNSAVTNSIASGVTYAVAAGNSSANACNYSPSSTPNALTVGATTSSDARASYSNFGTCLDVFAPGSSITSAWRTSNTATNTISGTSMASPHVAGVAALYLAFDPGASPAQVEGVLESNATPGVVTNPGSGSPNLLLYSLVTGGGSPPPPPPPPPPPSPLPTIHVGDVLAEGYASNGKSWVAVLYVRIHAEDESDIDGATVQVSWSGGATGSGSCMTAILGTCYIETGAISHKKPSVTFHIDNVTMSGFDYAKADNHDDPSDGSDFQNDEVTATKPDSGGGQPGNGRGNTSDN